MSTAIKCLKAGKAPWEDDIRPEMLKVMNNYGIRWLTRACQGAWKTGEILKQLQTSVFVVVVVVVCRHRLKGIHSRPDTNRTGAEGLSFYYPRLLNRLDQMLAVITSLPASDSGSSAVWGSKRINPRPKSCLCLIWSGYPSNDDDERVRRFPASQENKYRDKIKKINNSMK